MRVLRSSPAIRRAFYRSALPWLGLASLAGCASSEVVRANGSSCTRNADCDSDHCERDSRVDERICCAVACVPGTICALSGDRCVTCDASVESCVSPRIAGERCTADVDCESGTCLPDPASVNRCCRLACSTRCDENGECLDSAATPSSTARTPLASGGRGAETSSAHSGGAAVVPANGGAMAFPAGGHGGTAALGGAAGAAAESAGAPSASGLGGSSAGGSSSVSGECEEGTVRSCSESGALGACAAGQQRCQNRRWSPCSIAPGSRRCSAAADADCDGRADNQIDNVCQCAVGARRSCAEHPGKDGHGPCKAGTQSCELASDGASSRWGECLGAVAPRAADACDVPGDDANCNGIASEGCAGQLGQPLWSFDNGVQGWGIRLTDPSRLKGGSSLAFAADLGDPRPGALVVTVPFDGPNQKIELNVVAEPAVNVSGHVLRARVRLASGLSSDANAPGGIKLFAKSGNDFVYVSGRWRYFAKAGEWLDVSLDPAAPDLTTGSFNLKDVREVGFELRTFPDTTGVSAAVVDIDSVSF